jgi:xylan 1,4-beta-xylosidase
VPFVAKIPKGRLYLAPGWDRLSRMNRVNFERVNFNFAGDVKPIVTNLVHTWPHWHDEIEIVFSFHGELLLKTEDGERVLKEGEFAVVNSAETHAVNTLEKEKDAENIVFMLQLSRMFLRNMYADIDAVRFTETAGENTKNNEIRQSLRSFFLLIMDEEKSNNENKMAVIHGLCGAVVALLIRNFSVPLPLSRNRPAPYREGDTGGTEASTKDEYDKHSERLKRILNFVSRHYAENPSLNDIAKVVFVSPFYLSHFFTQTMGLSYSKYLNYFKINMARRDLVSTKDTIINILTRHGFANAKAFNRIFKAYIGCSPREYRKTVLEAGEDAYTSLIRPVAEGMPGSYVDFQNPVKIPGADYRDYKKNEAEPHTGELTLNQAEHARNITIENKRQDVSLDRYFLKMIGQARAGDFLRKKVQDHFRTAQREIGFEFVRFHGIFNDEMCIFTNQNRFDWTYVDDVFDFLLEINLKPFVELSFMPSALASGGESMFFYKGNITPPRDWEKWPDLVGAFTGHLIERYSLKRVSQWYFEVWNEPNIESYWAGTFDEYMRLYRITAERIKSISPAIKVGGPAVSSFMDHDACGFLKKFLTVCTRQGIPLDFISAHPYPAYYYVENGTLKEILLGPDSTKKDMVRVKKLVDGSSYPGAEIHLDEWNSSAHDRDFVHDTAFMAVFILRNYLLCGGLAASLCYWALSDRFEEHGLGGHEFHGGFGLLSVSGLKKPSYHAFRALKQLGNKILARGDDFIVTCSKADENLHGNTEVQALFWNYVHYKDDYAKGENGPPDFYDRYDVFEQGGRCCFTLNIPCGLFPEHTEDFLVEKTIFNRKQGSIFDFWIENGALDRMSDEQIEIIQAQCIPKQSMEIGHA